MLILSVSCIKKYTKHLFVAIIGALIPDIHFYAYESATFDNNSKVSSFIIGLLLTRENLQPFLLFFFFLLFQTPLPDANLFICLRAHMGNPAVNLCVYVCVRVLQWLMFGKRYLFSSLCSAGKKILPPDVASDSFQSAGGCRCLSESRNWQIKDRNEKKTSSRRL